MSGETQFFSESLPEPTGGGEWNNNFDYAEFDYIDFELFDLYDNIQSHHRYEQADEWLYHCFRDRKGCKCIEFLKLDSVNVWRQTSPYRMEWMENAKFVRNSVKPIDVKANSSNDARASPQLI
jgi:hypothetical protein